MLVPFFLPSQPGVNYLPFVSKHGWYFSQPIMWDKRFPVLTRKDEV